MKSKPEFKRWRRGGAVALAAWLATAGAQAQIAVPLYVGNLVPVLDQNGEPLEGNMDQEPEQRSRVELRKATDGVIRAPTVDGAAHPYNPLLTADSVAHIGDNTSEPGLFAAVLPLRPATGTRVFGRAFNAPTLAEASFYADAAAVPVSASAVSLVLTFGPAQPLDTGDADGDGLINSWEKALGIDDRATADYDGDGMRDYDEMLAGTAPDDFNSRLAFAAIRREAAAAPAGGASPDLLKLRFQCRPGRQYQVERVDTLLGAQVFVPVGGILTAGADAYELETEVDLPEFRTGAYRLRLVVAP